MNRAALVLVVCLLAGCARQDCVSGTVTYEGRPVEKGFITFHPVGDLSAPVGAEIIEGQYKVLGLKPGKKKVQVTATPTVVAVAQKGGKSPRVIAKKDRTFIPPNARGNQQEADIPKGEHTLDVQLFAPKR